MSTVIAYLLAFVAALPVWLAIALKVGVIVGLIGSLLEEIGKRFNLPRLVAVGQQIEGFAVDVPKIVSRIQGWDIPGLARKALALFGKAPLAVLLCLSLACAPSLPGCSVLKPAAAAQVPQDVAIAFKAAGAALAIADTVLADYADSIQNPTQDQVDRVAAAVARLQAVKDKLDEVKANLDRGRDKLRSLLDDVKDAEAALSAAGVKVPSSIDRALDEGAEVLQ